MASTYSSLKIQLMATGENSTTWGAITNTNLGTTLEEALKNFATVTFASADVTLTLTDANTSQTARNFRLALTGTTGGARNLIVPAITGGKQYVVSNGCADAVTVKNATGTGIAVPAGKTMMVYNDGTNVVDVLTYATSLTLGSALPVASGGTGATTSTGSGAVVLGTAPSITNATLTTPALTSATLTTSTVTGAGITYTGATSGTTIVKANATAGSWTFTLPSGPGTNGYTLQTDGAGNTSWVNNVGGGGTVTSINVVGGTTGLTTTGGPITGSGSITLGGTLAVANGGTGVTTSTGSGAVVLGTSPNLSSPSITSGTLTTSFVAGAGLTFNGSTSGTTIVKANATAGTWTLTLPTSAGTNGYILSTDGAGVTSWIANTGGGGTVTSINVSGGSTGFSFTGGPITGSGTITMAGSLGVAGGGTGAATLTGYVFGNGTSPMTASSTIPGASISGNITGTAGNVSGVVVVGNGGTGASSLTGYVKGNGSSAMTAVASIPGSDITGTVPAATTAGTCTGNSATATSATTATTATTANALNTGNTYQVSSLGVNTTAPAAGNITATGTIQGGAVSSTGNMSASGTITAATFSGAGTSLTGTAAGLTVGSATTAGSCSGNAATATTASSANALNTGNSYQVSALGVNTGAPAAGSITATGNASFGGTIYPGNTAQNIASDSTTLYLRGTTIAFQDAAASTTRASLSSGSVFSTSQFIGSTPSSGGQYAAVSGSTGAFFRNDGTSYYLLGNSASTTVYDNYRPLTVNLTTGAVAIDNGTPKGGTTVGGTLQVNGAATFASSVSAASLAGTALASAAQTATGSSTTQAITPAGMAGNATLAATGAYKFPGGYEEKWGSIAVGDIAGSANGSVTFTAAFPNALIQVSFEVFDSTGVGVSQSCIVGTQTRSTSGFTWVAREYSAVTQNVTLYWKATGY